MTGEVTLTGRVLPVGGVREKVLAARRAGIKSVLIPRHNEKDLVELPAEVKADLTFHLVDTLDDVVPRLFERFRRPPSPGAGPPRRRRPACRPIAGRASRPGVAMAEGSRRARGDREYAISEAGVLALRSRTRVSASSSPVRTSDLARDRDFA